jgi:anti-sigma-K factor RskA
MTSNLTPELDAMAGELALGVLEGEARAKALRMVLANPEFAARVAMWQQRLEPLGAAFSEVSPPAVWRAIEAELDSRERSRSVSALRLWRGSALVSGAIAASLAAVLVLTPAQQASAPPAPMPPAPTAIAQLSGEGDVVLAAELDTQQQLITIRAVTLPASELVPELWVLDGAGVPRSLGLIRAGGTTSVTVPDDVRALLVDGAILAVSLETAEGAPHASPSSTPIATGKIFAI